jgi:hypothetical protein
MWDFYDRNDRFPRSREEFEAGLQQFEEGPAVQEALRSGKFVLVYGGLTAPQAIGDGTEETVLAYRADVPMQGGPVLLCDGFVKEVTADEFWKMPQASRRQ